MKDCSMNWSVVTAVAVLCLELLWSDAVWAQVKLEHKFREGSKLTYRTRSRTRQVLNVMGTEIQSEEDTTRVTSRKVGKRRGDSSLPVEEKVESYRAALSLAEGNRVNFNSSDSSVKTNNPELAYLGDVFKLISGTAYTLVLDDKNKVKAIEGADRLLEKIRKLDEKGRNFLKGQFESQKLRASFEQALQILPDVPARAGEPWERTEFLEISGAPLTVRKKYEYAGTEKKGDKTLDKITSKVIEVTYKLDPDSKAPLKVAKSDLKVDSSTETILFDREAGHLVSSTGRLHVKGNMTFSGNGAEIPSAVDLRFDRQCELQPTSK